MFIALANRNKLSPFRGETLRPDGTHVTLLKELIEFLDCFGAINIRPLRGRKSLSTVLRATGLVFFPSSILLQNHLRNRVLSRVSDRDMC